VRANYFFGKPVDGEVTSRRRVRCGRLDRRTDREGAFQFDIRLPDFLAGRPWNQGAARVLVEATVKDTSGHSESRGEPVTVSEFPLLITSFRERFARSGPREPFVRPHVLSGWTPAESDIRVEAAGNAVQTSATDRGGIAIVSLPGSATNIRVKATDREGNRGSVRAELESAHWIRPCPAAGRTRGLSRR